MKKFLHKKSIYFMVIFLLLFSCKKEKITEKHAEFVGRWIELSGEDTYHELDIKDDSNGSYYECTRGPSGDCSDEHFRKWRIKNNHLYYGIANNLGEIMEYPTVATSDIFFGPNNSYTIKAGRKYMILNYRYWTISK